MTYPAPVLSHTPSNQSSVDATPQADRGTPQKSFDDLAASNDALGDEEKDIEKQKEDDGEERTGERSYLVEFDGPGDPGNPKSWTAKRRWAITVMMGSLVFTVTFASSIFSVNIAVVQEKFNVSMVEATLGVALFVLVCRPMLTRNSKRMLN